MSSRQRLPHPAYLPTQHPLPPTRALTQCPCNNGGDSNCLLLLLLLPCLPAQELKLVEKGKIYVKGLLEA